MACCDSGSLPDSLDMLAKAATATIRLTSIAVASPMEAAAPGQISIEVRTELA